MLHIAADNYFKTRAALGEAASTMRYQAKKTQDPHTKKALQEAVVRIEEFLQGKIS